MWRSKNCDIKKVKAIDGGMEMITMKELRWDGGECQTYPDAGSEGIGDELESRYGKEFC